MRDTMFPLVNIYIEFGLMAIHATNCYWIDLFVYTHLCCTDRTWFWTRKTNMELNEICGRTPYVLCFDTSYYHTLIYNLQVELFCLYYFSSLLFCPYVATCLYTTCICIYTVPIFVSVFIFDILFSRLYIF